MSTKRKSEEINVLFKITSLSDRELRLGHTPQTPRLALGPAVINILHC